MFWLVTINTFHYDKNQTQLVTDKSRQKKIMQFHDTIKVKIKKENNDNKNNNKIKNI